MTIKRHLIYQTLKGVYSQTFNQHLSLLYGYNKKVNHICGKKRLVYWLFRLIFLKLEV